MINRLKNLVRNSAVYSINSIAEKAVGVILIPLMTFYFSKEQFGDWDILDNTINILADVLIFGFATVVVFFNNPKEYPYEKKSSFFTLILFLLSAGVLFILAVEALLSFNLFPGGLREGIAGVIRIATYIIAVRVINNFILGRLRADELAVKYTVIYSIKLFVRTGLIVLFILFTDRKWEGVFYSSLIAEVLIFFILSPVLFRSIEFKLNLPALKTSVKIGAALVLSTIGFNLLNLSDRYIIKYLIGSGELGIYALGYRAAGILNMFLILPFTLTLLPSTYKVYKQKDDTRYFSKIMTYSTFFFAWGFAALSLFSKEIVKIFGQGSDFERAWIVVPVILLGYVFSGMRLNAQLGMLLTKNTKFIGITTLISAAFNIVLNFIFIPVYGIIAAAVSTLLSYMLFYFLTLYKSNQYYRIPFERGKLALMVITASILSSAVYIIPDLGALAEWGIKLVLIISFPFILYLFNFYEKAELDIILNREKLTGFVKGIFKKQNGSSDDEDLMIK